jgi:2,4-dienoyl-CoA reductase-like NADH-dependent reductase (Old Yellow Enzyme family)
MPYPRIFEPLAFRSLTAKNRIFRSNVSGRFDNYDGSGTQTRINWELKFARGGVGAIISSFIQVTPRGRIVPNYAMIDRDERIPFWRELARQVHQHDCRFIMQLSHAGRQRDVPGIEFQKGLSATAKPDPLHGFECERMTRDQIAETVEAFAEGARRAREAGVDGVELHSANGYLFTQFLSSGINDRNDEYGGSLLNDEQPGNTIKDSVRVCQWLEEAGVDAIHVSSGSYFPHPRNPAGDFPLDELVKTYDTLLSSGMLTVRNYLLFRGRLTGRLFKRRWEEARGDAARIEGINLPDAQKIKAAVRIPVLCTGGFQTAAIIENAIAKRKCDAVTIARPLIANNDLVQMFARGVGRPPKPCTYCNRCLVNAVENPLGCYDESRYTSRGEMVREVMTVFDPPPFR